ncbi:unnamed protein product [Vitrella brassicaformis CCMP3155]|uniref:Chitin-binding type-2 domain-containing protein n=2 Tax=Vitrella brassicaformis TaxID=1169539 RepID=A0A0G4H459_VITBC|nr:unnamed protein product [Vitrella brassicaformis CCMP3155]|eukprot:CEM38535.1 unnamed protein product [Vitrella brassicaformis CCMP3155]
MMMTPCFGIIMVVGLAAIVAAQRNSDRQMSVGEGSYGPDCEEGKDCSADVNGPWGGASFLGTQEIQARNNTKKHGVMLSAGELSMLQQKIQTGKAMLHSAMKLKAEANRLAGSAIEAIDNVVAHPITSTGAAYSGTYATAVRASQPEKDECEEDKDCGENKYCFEPIQRAEGDSSYKRRCKRAGDEDDRCYAGFFKDPKKCKFGLYCAEYVFDKDRCTKIKGFIRLEGPRVKAVDSSHPAYNSECWRAYGGRTLEKLCPEGMMCAITRDRGFNDMKLKRAGIFWALEGNCVPFAERAEHCEHVKCTDLLNSNYQVDDYTCTNWDAGESPFHHCKSNKPYTESVCPAPTTRLTPKNQAGKSQGQCQVKVEFGSRYYVECAAGLVCVINQEQDSRFADYSIGQCFDPADVASQCRKREDYDPKKEGQPAAVAEYRTFQTKKCEYLWVHQSGRHLKKPFTFCAGKEISKTRQAYRPSSCDSFDKKAFKFAPDDLKDRYCTGADDDENKPCGPKRSGCKCNSYGTDCSSSHGRSRYDGGDSGDESGPWGDPNDPSNIYWD